MLKEKYSDSLVCKTCNQLLIEEICKEGQITPKSYFKITCPVCKRGLNEFEGRLVLEGKFLNLHREWITSLIDSTAIFEAKKHPLDRIIEIKNIDDKLEITTTYEYLARKLGEAIHKMYQGELKYNYLKNKHITGTWTRDY